MLFELKVAFRFLKHGKIQTLFIIIGIALGVAVQIFLSSLISGLQDDLVNKTIGSAPHVVIKPKTIIYETSIKNDDALINSVVSDTKPKASIVLNWENIYNRLKSVPEIKKIAPFADGSGYISKGNKTVPIIIRGTYAQESDKIYNFSSNMADTKFILSSDEIYIGKTLSKDLNININDSIKISTDRGASDIFRIKGVFDLENEEINNSWVIMDFNRSQKLISLNGNATKIEIQIDEVFSANDFKKSIEWTFEDVSIETWQETNQSLLSALESQSISSSIIQFFVIVSVALAISSVLAISVMQKSKQIGILKAMGTKNISIARIFLFQGGILGFLGSIFGCGTAMIIVKLFELYASKSNTDLFSIIISSKDYAFSISIAIVVGILASFIPAKNSAKLSPIEVIRNG